jgi:hypothetical protein
MRIVLSVIVLKSPHVPVSAFVAVGGCRGTINEYFYVSKKLSFFLLSIVVCVMLAGRIGGNGSNLG